MTGDKARRVRVMFDAIAPRYERVNRMFSVGRDAAWRRRAVQLARVGRDDAVLDLACGTGDFARAFASAGVGRVVGLDFSHQMLLLATSKQTPLHPPLIRGDKGGCHPAGIHYLQADALNPPFSDKTFSIISCAFGVRNFEAFDDALQQMYRVLRPGGRAVILEFTRPGNRFIRRLYELYFTRFMPQAATWIARDRTGAYRYLPQSVLSFLDAGQMCARLQAAGFTRVSATPLTFGIVTVYLAHRD